MYVPSVSNLTEIAATPPFLSGNIFSSHHGRLENGDETTNVAVTHCKDLIIVRVNFKKTKKKKKRKSKITLRKQSHTLLFPKHRTRRAPVTIFYPAY